MVIFINLLISLEEITFLTFFFHLTKNKKKMKKMRPYFLQFTFTTSQATSQDASYTLCIDLLLNLYMDKKICISYLNLSVNITDNISL